MSAKNQSILITLTFLLVLGLYAGGFYLYRRYNSTVTAAGNTVGFLDNVFSIFKGK